MKIFDEPGQVSEREAWIGQNPDGFVAVHAAESWVLHAATCGILVGNDLSGISMTCSARLLDLRTAAEELSGSIEWCDHCEPLIPKIGEVVDRGAEGWGIELTARYASREEAEEVLRNLEAECVQAAGHRDGHGVLVDSRDAPSATPELVIGAGGHGPLLRPIRRIENPRGSVRMYGREVAVSVERFLAENGKGLRLWRVDS